MEVTGARENDVIICQLTGRLDAATSPEVEAKTADLVGDDGKYLVGDLSGLDYISSAGLRILLMRAKQMAGRGGKMVLCGLKPEVRQVFDIAGFSKIIPIYDDQDQAKAAVTG